MPIGTTPQLLLLLFIPFGTKSFVLITLPRAVVEKGAFEPVLYIYFALFPNGSYLETADVSETAQCTIR